MRFILFLFLFSITIIRCLAQTDDQKLINLLKNEINLNKPIADRFFPIKRSSFSVLPLTKKEMRGFIKESKNVSNKNIKDFFPEKIAWVNADSARSSYNFSDSLFLNFIKRYRLIYVISYPVYYKKMAVIRAMTGAGANDNLTFLFKKEADIWKIISTIYY